MYKRLFFLFLLIALSASINAATFTVTKTADTDDGVCNADCSLREAIGAANQNGAIADTINFAIPGSGVKTINVSSALPSIVFSLTINGQSQSGYFGKPLIELRGTPQVNNGLYVLGPGPFGNIAVQINALAINSFGSAGVYSYCVLRCDLALRGNFIGTDPTGTTAMPNGIHGVSIVPSAGSEIIIGGSGALEGNLISGNGGPETGNQQNGINIEPPPQTSEVLGAVQISIVGNKIGTDFNGNAALGNTDNGIRVTEDSLNGGDIYDMDLTIGGPTATARNVISGNNGNGIDVSVTTLSIKGNYIGINANGTGALGNMSDNDDDNGISIKPRAQVVYQIGGNEAGEGNVISANGGNGIAFSSGGGAVAGLSTSIIAGNLIGTNAAGNADLGNLLNGIAVMNAPDVDLNVVVGTVEAGSGNIISGNGANGVLATAENVFLLNNRIGTDIDGNTDLGNDSHGVFITGSVPVSAKIGDTSNGGTAGAGNVISGNGGDGIRIDASVTPGLVLIERNMIGTNAAGNAAIANGGNGIYSTVSGIVIGSNSVAEKRNIISGNAQNGVFLSSASDTGIFGNRIGTNSAGDQAIPNGTNGIMINASPNNNIAANVISGNTLHGINISNAWSGGNHIDNNAIGLGVNGNDLGNAASGIFIQSSAGGNFVGTTLPNFIAFNQRGVFVQSGTDNEIRKNAIFANDELGIDLDVVGVTPNDPLDADSGGNRKQNFPVITRSLPTNVIGSLNSTPSSSFSIDLFRTDACDASGHGEGRFYLGTVPVVTDGAGNGSFSFPANLQIGQTVTATATTLGPLHDTSEFSACSVVIAPPALSFSASAYTASEAAAARTIVVTRTGTAVGPASVDYNASNGSATVGEDYQPTSGTLLFGDGETIKSFDVAIINDTSDEPDETINLTLSNPGNGAALGSTTAAVLTLTDNDNPPTVSVGDIAAPEGNSGQTAFSFNVSLSSPSAFPVTVNFATDNGTANLVDYTGLSGSVNFAPGEASKSLSIQVNGDVAFEPDETFFVNLSNPSNASLGDAQGLGTIINDDSSATYSISGAVRRADGRPVANAIVAIPSAGIQTSTDIAGQYTLNQIPAGGNYTVVAVANSYRFSPPTRLFQNLQANSAGADFTAIQKSPFDFDGDGKSDHSIFRPNVGEWWILRSSDGSNNAAQFGLQTDRIVAGDWTGDGRTDMAFWRESNGNWYVLRSENSTFFAFPFGSSGDIVAPGDYDGDGLTDAAVFRPTAATWFIRNSGGGTTIDHFGQNGDKPVAGDFDGDGRTDIAIYRPASGQWWIKRSSTLQVVAAQFGTASDMPAVQDYTGDGKADIAFWRPADGTWYVLRSEDGSYYSVPFGTIGDRPGVGDFDGDGKGDLVIFRPAAGTWYVNRSTAGVSIVSFGANGDLPVPSQPVQ